MLLLCMQMEDMVSNMSDDQLREMGRMAGREITREQLAASKEAIRSMTPEQMESMASIAKLQQGACV